MKKKHKVAILLIFIALVVFGAILGYLTWNKPHKDVKDATALKVTAPVLYRSLTVDSMQTKSNFINKVVAVSGEVKNVAKNQQNQQIILLNTNISGGAINCTMEEEAQNIKVGDHVQLKGICSGYIGGDAEIGLPGDVYLIRCYRSI